MSDNLDRDDAARAVILEYASDIVSAYVSNNPIQSEELPNLIRDVHSTLKELKASNGAQVTRTSHSD